MTGDSDVTRCDWLQQARIEISSNTIIFHDETFVKMATVEDIINRLSEERQRCYQAHSEAETRQQEQKITTSCIHCISCGKQISSYHQLIFRGIAFCPECIEQEKDIEPRHRAAIAHAAREDERKKIRNRLILYLNGRYEKDPFISIITLKGYLQSYLRQNSCNRSDLPDNTNTPDCCGVNCPDLSQGCKDHCPNGYDHEKATASEQKGGRSS